MDGILNLTEYTEVLCVLFGCFFFFPQLRITEEQSSHLGSHQGHSEDRQWIWIPALLVPSPGEGHRVGAPQVLNGYRGGREERGEKSELDEAGPHQAYLISHLSSLCLPGIPSCLQPQNPPLLPPSHHSSPPPQKTPAYLQRTNPQVATSVRPSLTCHAHSNFPLPLSQFPMIIIIPLPVSPTRP